MNGAESLSEHAWPSLGDPFHLPFSTQIGLDFGKHAEQVQSFSF
jgi:hypothetical protein